MNEEVQILIQKAEHALLVAEKLIVQGFEGDAASKVYYAISTPRRRFLKIPISRWSRRNRIFKRYQSAAFIPCNADLKAYNFIYEQGRTFKENFN